MTREIYYSGNESRAAYAREAQPQELWDQLLAKFPWVNQNEYFSISEPSFHEVMQEPVITCNVPWPQSEVLCGPTAALAARKFCMDSVTSYLRIYRLPEGDRPVWMPADAKWFAYGKNFEEFGKPFNPICQTFEDYYFGGNPEVIEPHFNLPQRRGAYDTYYGATVVNGQVVRVKQYCYEEQGVFSDWEVAYIALCKRYGRLDML